MYIGIIYEMVYNIVYAVSIIIYGTNVHFMLIAPKANVKCHAVP